MTYQLDDIDKKILQLLQANARISNLELAQAVNLSPTPCARRVKQLEQAGVITGYTTQINAQALGYALTVYIAISMDRHTAERFANFEKQVLAFPEVVQCSIVTGRSEDYLLKAVVRDMAHYEDFLLNRLNRIDGVSQVHTSFELRAVLNRCATAP